LFSRFFFVTVQIVGSFEEAVESARKTDKMPFVIGGTRVFNDALPHATHLYITEIIRMRCYRVSS